jgi:hypothetical protein
MRLVQFSVAVLALLVLAGCGRQPQAERPAWRAEAERRCLRANLVRLGAGIRQAPPLNPGGYCGADHPLQVAAFERSGVSFSRPVPMTCPMVVATERWVEDVVQPAAQSQFGQRVVEIETSGTYNCRRVMNRSHGAMSEHSFANAIDISGFRLEDGRRVRVGRPFRPGLPSPWRFQEERSLGVSMDGGGLDLLSIGPGIDGAQPPEINFGSSDARAFWRAVRDGACRNYTTVLGPGYEGHSDHLHLDLARRVSRGGGQRTVCR